MVLQPHSPSSPPTTDPSSQLPGDGLSPRPLGLLLNPAGTAIVSAGDELELTATVSNQGSVSAIIDLYISELSQPVHQWCLSSRERVALNPGQSSELVFKISVPADVLPDLYHYTLILDAPQHYPQDTPIEQVAQLQVTPLISETRTTSDPVFALQPQTHSQAPAQLQPGQSLELYATVHNRSDRVDRFYLTCPDLDPAAVHITYPQGVQPPGMMIPSDCLELNPGETKQILLTITPPAHSWAGTFSPTVRVHSANHPDLALLDIVYLEILPIYGLNVEFLSIIAKVKREAGLFQLRLSNQGNTPREVTVAVNRHHEDSICEYSLTPSQLHLLPGESASATLQVKPIAKWRPFFGRAIDFQVELRDIADLPLVNDRFQGSLFWEPRPWWQFLALVLLTSVTVASLVFLLWWRLTRPATTVRVVEFLPTRYSYDALSGEPIRLNWVIRHPNRLSRLRLVGLSADGEVLSGPRVYDFSQGLPEGLNQFCELDEQLICRNVWTDARQAGTYRFELTALSNRAQADSEVAHTNSIQIHPPPNPEFVEFASSQPSYQEFKPSSRNGEDDENEREDIDINPILLNWVIRNPRQLQELRLLGLATDGSVSRPEIRYDFSSGIPESLQEFCTHDPLEQSLICRDVPTGVTAAGDYVFEASLISNQAEMEVTNTEQTQTIKIIPQEIPSRIVELTFNGEAPPPKWVHQLGSEDNSIDIAWEVDGSEGIIVELLPAPGTVPRQGELTYPLSQNPGQETITLQVTNEKGEQHRRSIVIETLAAPSTPDSLMMPPSLEELLEEMNRDAEDDSSNGSPGGNGEDGDGGDSGDDDGDESSPERPEKEPLGERDARPRFPEDDPLAPVELDPQFN